MALKYTNTAPPATTLDTSEFISIRTIPCPSVYARSACRTASIPQYILRDHAHCLQASQHLSIHISSSLTYPMTLGISLEFLNPSDPSWPFRSSFKQLLYIYNEFLNLSLFCWGLGANSSKNAVYPGDSYPGDVYF